jgi:hypothetical protein
LQPLSRLILNGSSGRYPDDQRIGPSNTFAIGKLSITKIRVEYVTRWFLFCGRAYAFAELKKALIAAALEHRRVDHVTVRASHYSAPSYEHSGVVVTGPTGELQGLKYVPMQLICTADLSTTTGDSTYLGTCAVAGQREHLLLHSMASQPGKSPRGRCDGLSDRPRPEPASP